VYRDIANNTFGSISGALGTVWSAEATGDVNGDGFTDVIYYNTATGQVIYANLAGGSNSGFGAIAGGLIGWDVRSAGDWNNDGYDDVIIQNTSNGQTVIATLVDGVFTGFDVATFAIGSDWIAI
jgi:hypothetical protein